MLYMILWAILAVVLLAVVFTVAAFVFAFSRRRGQFTKWNLLGFQVEGYRHHEDCGYYAHFLRSVELRKENIVYLFVHLYEDDYLGWWENSDSYWGWFPILSRRMLTKRWALCVVDMSDPTPWSSVTS